MPVVAQTVADFCERPIANAFGIEVSITHDARLGQVGLHAQALDDPVQLGVLRRGDLLGAERREGDLVGGEQLRRRSSTTATITMIARAGADGDAARR